MEVSGQLHITAAPHLPSRETAVRTERTGTGWAPDPVWTLCGKKKNPLSLLGQGFLGHYPMLSQLTMNTGTRSYSEHTVT